MVELLRVVCMVLLIVAAGLLVTPWACVLGAPVWVVAQYITRPGARLSVWRLQ